MLTETDAPLSVRAGLLEGHRVLAGALEHPAAERDDQAGILRDRDERRRRDGAAHRVLPAQQRLVAADLAGLQVEDRLVGERQLLAPRSPP